MNAWSPLRQGGFRALWLASFASLTGSWISDSTAAWLMTSLSGSPLMVAMVSSAITLPILMMALPAGALADLFDRRSVLMATQVWVTLIALVLFAVTLAGRMSAELLLVLTFAHGIGSAIRFPVMAAMTPGLVPRAELPSALALHGVTFNGARVIGPVIAGLLLGWIGGAWVFLVCAAVSAATTFAFARVDSQQRTSSLPNERFVAAMRLGIQYARQSPAVVAALAQISLYTFFAVVMQALLPLVARDRLGGDAGTYTMLLSSMGFGAIAGVMAMPALRRRLSPDQMLAVFTILQAAGTALLSQATNPWLAAPAAFAGGAAWTAIFNVLNVTTQTALPDWVRARGTAVFLASGMIGATAGAVAWGQVASFASIERALEVAAVGALIGFRAAAPPLPPGRPRRDRPHAGAGHARVCRRRDHPGRPGPVLVTIDYQIAPARAEEFSAVMAESRRWRLRHGALHWGLYRDVADPGRYRRALPASIPGSTGCGRSSA
jgi:MFS family permease